jgi:hypothetical protein
MQAEPDGSLLRALYNKKLQYKKTAPLVSSPAVGARLGTNKTPTSIKSTMMLHVAKNMLRPHPGLGAK